MTAARSRSSRSGGVAPAAAPPAPIPPPARAPPPPPPPPPPPAPPGRAGAAPPRPRRAAHTARGSGRPPARRPAGCCAVLLTSTAGTGGCVSGAPFVLPEEYEELRSSVRRLAEEAIAPNAAACDDKEEYPWASWEAWRAAGFAALPFPEEYGGQGAGTLAHGIAVEEVARACASASLFTFIGN